MVERVTSAALMAAKRSLCRESVALWGSLGKTRRVSEDTRSCDMCE